MKVRATIFMRRLFLRQNRGPCRNSSFVELTFFWAKDEYSLGPAYRREAGLH